MKKLLLLTGLLMLAPMVKGQPPWWNAAEKASAEAWLRTAHCQCEQSFAVDVDGPAIQIRVFNPLRSGSHESAFTVNLHTVAIFHTHPNDSVPSREDKELERRYRIPFFVIHGSDLIECR